AFARPEEAVDPAPDPLDVDHGPGTTPPPTWRARLEQVADATGTTPARVLAGTGLVALAVVGGLWLTRPPADPVEASLPFASTTVAAEVPTSSIEPEVVVVHVAGAVARPGVYELAAGARVLDAVTAAGGLDPAADERQLNLAAPGADRRRVHRPPDAAALEALPGVGPATAAAIVEHRERIGRFTSVEQLLDVRGIGEAKLAALRDLVAVGRAAVTERGALVLLAGAVLGALHPRPVP